MTEKHPARLAQDQNWIDTTQVSRRTALIGSAAFAGYALAVQPVAASTITTDTAGLDAGMTSFPTGGLRMNAYRAKPAGKRNLPIVIVVQEIFGLHEWVKDICRRYAKAGFYAIAPDLYQRQGDATKVSDFKVLISEIVAKVPDAQVMGDLDAVARFAGTDGGNATKLGITGFCWGGRIVWLYAAHNPRLKAGVACYGRLTGAGTVLQPKYPIDLISAINAPVLGLYGALDKGIPVADTERMLAALKAAKKPSAIHLFAGADHGFFADYRPSYNEAAAKQGWAEAVGWFRRFLR